MSCCLWNDVTSAHLSAIGCEARAVGDLIARGAARVEATTGDDTHGEVEGSGSDENSEAEGSLGLRKDEVSPLRSLSEESLCTMLNIGSRRKIKAEDVWWRCGPSGNE